MKDAGVLKTARVFAGWGKLLRGMAAPALWMALASQAHATTAGICLVSSSFGLGGTTSAEYASADISAGCNPGFFPGVNPGGSVNPTSLAAGLTTGTLTTTQTMPFGGTAIATSTASLDQGVLRDYSDTQGTLGSCGGTCMTTGGRATAESLFGDSLHFTITDGATSAIVTLHAHLDGIIGIEAGGAGSYGILEQFGLGGGGCWESLTGLGGAPCLSGNGGFLTSSFSNQSASGFDFTGTFAVTNGAIDPFFAALQVDCSGGALCDFSSTAAFSLSLPSNVTFTSDSGVLFTQAAGSAAPEPGTFAAAAAVLLGLGFLRRRGAKPQR